MSKLCKISKTSAEIHKIARNSAKLYCGVGSPAWSEAAHYQLPTSYIRVMISANSAKLEKNGKRQSAKWYFGVGNPDCVLTP